MSSKKKLTQPGPKYPSMTIGVHPEIYNHLRAEYGEKNVCWPILVYDLSTLDIQYILIEVNSENNINQIRKRPLLGPAPFPEYKLDYMISPRPRIPTPLGHKIPWKGPSDILLPKYNSSYEFVTQRGGLNTIDVDYVWQKPNGELFGLETSTFYMNMKTEEYTEHLVRRFIEERASRKRAHHFHILSQAASKIGIQMSLVFLNVLGHSKIIRTKGYVYSIPLNVTSAKQLHSGIFVKGEYLLFSEWLNSL